MSVGYADTDTSLLYSPSPLHATVGFHQRLFVLSPVFKQFEETMTNSGLFFRNGSNSTPFGNSSQLRRHMALCMIAGGTPGYGMIF